MEQAQGVPLTIPLDLKCRKAERKLKGAGTHPRNQYFTILKYTPRHPRTTKISYGSRIVFSKHATTANHAIFY